MKREWFIFYQSFWNATKHLPEENQKNALLMIVQYWIDWIEPELNIDPIAYAMFLMAKPQIDTNNWKYEKWSQQWHHWVKGKEYWQLWWRPRKETPHSWEKKPPSNPPKEKDKENVKEKEKENIKEEYSVGWSSEMKESFEWFRQMRIKKNKPLTDYATRLIINKLRKLATSETGWIKLLDQSTTNNWTDIYELKDTWTKLTTEEIIKRNRDLTPKYSWNAITRLHEVTTGQKQVEDTGSWNDDW